MMIHQVQDSHRPLVITQNGRASAVLISPIAFDLLTEQTRFVDAVQRGLVDAESGRMMADEDLDIEL
jgi:prevent-host-death family protein